MSSTMSSQPATDAQALAVARGQSPNQRAWARFKRNRKGYVALWVFGILLALCTLAEVFRPRSLAAVGGTVLLALAVDSWRRAGFGDLDYAHTMRLVVPGATATALGIQMIFASFFASLLGLRRV